MKIWLLAENWPPRRGGIENYLTHIAEQLVALGHQVTVFAPSSANLPAQQGEARSAERGSQEATRPEGRQPTTYQVIRQRFFWPLIRPAWLPLFVFLWRRAKREHPDVLLCGKGLFEGLLGYYLFRHLKLPYVVFTYAMEVAVWSGNTKTKRQLQRVLHSAKRIVCINDVTRHALHELGAAPENVLKITPGVDARFLRPRAPALVDSTIKHFGLCRPYIISVGRLIPRKGFDTLLEAFSRLDQTKYAALKLVIIGEGDDEARLKQAVADAYMQTSVVFLGAVPDTHLPALYAGAELFALTPRDIAGDSEGFGIVYLEAGAVGLPTLATATGGVPEAVEDGVTGILVAPDDPAALAKALAALLADKEQRQRLGQASQARVRQLFTWTARQEELNGLLKALTYKSA